MAIVKMKHLRMVAMVQERETLLRKLQHMGCVEIVQPELDPDDPLLADLTHPETGGLAAAHGEQTEAERALEVLKRYAPQKKGLLSARPEIPEASFLDESGAQKARDMAREVNTLDRRLAAIHAEEAKLDAQKDVLRPWMGLDLPLETGSTGQVAIQLGTLPASIPMNQAEGELQAAGELAQLTESDTDRDFHYCMLVYHTSQEEAVLEALKALGWSRANLRDWKGTASENLGRLGQETKALKREAASIEEKLSGLGSYHEPLRQLSDLAGVNVSREEARGRLLDTKSAFFLEGWVPAERWDEVRRELDACSCAYEAEDPAEEEYPKVPVQLKNNWFTKPLNMVTDMYSLPAYGSLDPNPLMAPFFILFYGMMMADMGYGLIMMIASVVVIKKAKPKGATMRYMMPLLGLCGVSTFLWGAATGGFFGDLIPQLVQLMNPDSTFALPKLFDPLDKAVNVLVGALVLGVVQIMTGMAVSVVHKMKKGQVMDAVCEEITWYVILVGAALAVIGITPIVLVLGLVMLVVGCFVRAYLESKDLPRALLKAFGRSGMGIFGSLYNNITGYFSDILSYSRLMALMLAGAVTAQVFNTLGAMTGNVFFFFVIAMVGNGLNFALNILGCFVHDMRLQCLEYFGRFYEDGGKPFKPVAMDTKYVDIKEI